METLCEKFKSSRILRRIDRQIITDVSIDYSAIFRAKQFYSLSGRI